MTPAELYAFALANKHKPWARRWLKANGKWNWLTVPDKTKYRNSAPA